MEAIYLVCGAGGPQLKRNPLGSASMPWFKASLFLLLLAACAPTLEEALKPLSPTKPDTPVTVSDTLVALALLQYLAGSHPQRYLIVGRAGYLVSSRALPHRDSIDFFILDSAEIRRLAFRMGEIPYTQVNAPRMGGDSAIVGVATMLALYRSGERFGIVFSESCSWLFRRHAQGWSLERVIGCLIS